MRSAQCTGRSGRRCTSLWYACDSYPLEDRLCLTATWNASPPPWWRRAREFWLPTRAPAPCTKRFDKIGIDSTEENRRAYRELLFTTPDVAQWISGVILYDETIRQKTRDGVPFPDYLTKLGVAARHQGRHRRQAAGAVSRTRPSPKVSMACASGLIEYYKLGARFAKWRAVIDIGTGIPTRGAIEANAQALARYAALCQEQNIVPIVEPEVLMDGAHTHRALRGGHRCRAGGGVRAAAAASHSSRGHDPQAEHGDFRQEVCDPGHAGAGGRGNRALPQAPRAERGARHCLSFGWTDAARGDVAPVAHESRSGSLPWQLSFSYGRALQDAALSAWAGKPGNVAAAQKQFQKWARLNGLARSGSFQAGMEQQAA